MNFFRNAKNLKNYTKIINNIFCAGIILILLELPDFIFSKIDKNYLFSFDFKDRVMIIFAILISFLNYKHKKILFIFFYILIFIELSYFNYFGALLAPYDILLFFHNTFEIFDAFKDMFLKFITPFTITSLSLIFSLFILKKCDKHIIVTQKYLFFFVISGLFIMPLIVAYQIHIKHKEVPGRNPKLYTPAIKNMINVSDYFLAVTLPKSLFNQNKTAVNFPPLQRITNPQNINIVFIIGESFRAKNAYILGYKKNNMPLLSNQPIIAKKCISIGTMTKVSLGYILNGASSLNEISKIYTHNFSLFKLAKDSGFKTTFITAQPSVSFKYIKNLIDLKHIDNFKTPLQITHSKFSALNDIQLVNLLKHNLKQKNFIIFQMNGSHFPYSNKSPKNFKKFKSEYDNSILYTDYVLNKMINYIKTLKNPTYFFFVSDHGELLGEYGQRGHGRLKKEVYEVPFIYFSNTKNQIIEKFLKQQKILYQGDIIKILEYLMGYKIKLSPNNNRKVEVIGRDISGYVGYKIITIKDNSIKESKVLYK